jgi:hypothetical protein
MKLKLGKTLSLNCAIVAAVALVLWIVVSLRNDDSILSILVRHVPAYMGWPSDSTSFGVLQRMSKYEKQGRYDAAIKAGIRWTEKNSDSGSNERIYTDISALYLKQAVKDRTHGEEYVKQAVLYRDKALPFAVDSKYALQRLAAVSESMGDLSATQRCVQYRNSIKLLDRTTFLLNEDKDRVARLFKPDPNEPTLEEIKRRSERVDASVNRIRIKLQNSACQ